MTSSFQAAGGRGVGADVQGSEIKLGNEAQGDVMYHNGTKWVRLAAGTSGQALKTQGAAANPIWGDVGGAMSLLTTVDQTVAAATMKATFTGVSAVMFRAYMLRSANSTNIRLRFNSNTDSQYNYTRNMGAQSANQAQIVCDSGGTAIQQGALIHGFIFASKTGTNSVHGWLNCGELEDNIVGNVIIFSYDGAGTKTEINEVLITQSDAGTFTGSLEVWSVAQA